MARPQSGSPRDSTATIGFEAKLWLTADKLRNNMDAAEYRRAERDRRSKPARKAGAEAPVIHGPACGFGGLFVLSEQVIESHGPNSNGMQLALAA